jgi:hypothetical protein
LVIIYTHRALHREGQPSAVRIPESQKAPHLGLFQAIFAVFSLDKRDSPGVKMHRQGAPADGLSPL